MMQQFDLILDRKMQIKIELLSFDCLVFFLIFCVNASIRSLITPLWCPSLLRSQVLPAGQTGELHPAAGPPEPLLRLPGEIWLQSHRPASHHGWRSCDEAARHVNLGPTAVSPTDKWFLFSTCMVVFSWSGFPVNTSGRVHGREASEGWHPLSAHCCFPPFCFDATTGSHNVATSSRV